MKDLIATIIILLILGMAISYIVKAKKNGAKCIGCPSGGSCSTKDNGESCSCGCCDCSEEK